MAEKEEVDLFDIDMLSKFSAPSEEPSGEEEIEETEEQEEIEEESVQEDIVPNETEEEEEQEEESEEEEGKDSPLLNFARLLKENGVLPDADLANVKETQDLIGLVSKQIELENNKYKETLPPPHKDIADLIENGFSEKEAIGIEKNRLAFESLTDEAIEGDLNVAKNVYETHLRAEGYSDKHIAKLLKASEEDIVEEALASREALKQRFEAEVQANIEAKKTQEAEEEAQRQKTLAELKKQIDSTEEIIPGRKIPAAQRKKLYEMITQPIDGKDGQPINTIQKLRQEDPLRFEITLAYLVSQGVFSGKWDSLMKTAKTQVTKDFENSLFNSASSTGGAGAQTQKVSGNEQTKALVDSLRFKL
jgi:hypothetical protein